MKNTNFLWFTALLMLSCSSTFAQLKWEEYNGRLPENVVIGGSEGSRDLPICRCEYKGAMHPGKVVDKACNIGWGGLEKTIKYFEVLVNHGNVGFAWEKMSNVVPDHAVEGGVENGKSLYIGRASYKNSMHPGKIFQAGKGYICNIGYGGKEITMNDFEILVTSAVTDLHESHDLDHDERCEKTFGDKPYSITKFVGGLRVNQRLEEGFNLVSPDLKYEIKVTDDGRLVIMKVVDFALCNDGRIIIFDSKEIWSNMPKGRNPALDYYLVFQEDGNVCTYSEQEGFVWCSMTHKLEADHLDFSNAGKLELFDEKNKKVWENK